MIEDRVKRVINDQYCLVNRDVHNGDTFEGLGSDSLDQVELEMAMEDEFGIKIPDGDTDSMSTVQDVIDYITKRVTA